MRGGRLWRGRRGSEMLALFCEWVCGGELGGRVGLVLIRWKKKGKGCGYISWGFFY